MADIMAAPVTPGGMSESIEELLDKSMESESANETRSKAYEDLFSMGKKEEDVKMEQAKSDLRALEDAVKSAGTEDFKPAFYAFGKAVLEHCNGARNVLTSVLGDELAHGQEFLNQIAEFFPKSDAISFATQLPGNDSDEFNLHLTDLSWLPHSSTKPAPYLHTCLQLWDEITTNGFIYHQRCLNFKLFVVYIFTFLQNLAGGGQNLFAEVIRFYFGMAPLGMLTKGNLLGFTS